MTERYPNSPGQYVDVGVDQPSEAAMRVAQECVGDKHGRFTVEVIVRKIARAIDAQKEKDAKIAEDMASYCRRTGAWKTLDEAAAAIRSAP